jgi:hypothetical protein
VVAPASPSNSTLATADPTLTEKGNPASAQLQESPETTRIQPENAAVAPVSAAKSAVPAFLLEITGKEKCWVSINSDGSSVSSRTIQPGEVLSFNASQRLLVIVGNAGGVSLKINGKMAKPLGKSGEVIKVLINETTLPDLLDRSPG